MVDTALPARSPRAFLVLLLLAFTAGALAVCWAYTWRWRGAEAATQTFARAVLAGDGAALARLGADDLRAGELLRLGRDDPEGARRCLGELRFVEGQRVSARDARLYFATAAECPLGYPPAMFLVRRVGGSWQVRDVYFLPFHRPARVGARGIPTA